MKPGSETTDLQCPKCGAAIHAPASARARRLQCPKCREIVVIEKAAAGAAKAVVVSAPQMLDEVSLLKARVEALEQAMAVMQKRVADGSRGTKIHWVSGGSVPDFSDLQAAALRDNLIALPAQEIIIETLRSDTHARKQAEWFKAVFTEAHWSVHGPEDAPLTHITRPGVSLATGLPVSAKAAATYLAVRAAGFDIETIFDSELSEEEPRLVVATRSLPPEYGQRR